MKFLKQHSNTILLSLFEILVGILLLIDPIGFTSGIITAFGIVLLAGGIICIVNYFRMDAVAAAASQSLAKGLVAVGAGTFCIFKTGWFIATFPLLTILYGIAVLGASMIKIQWTVDVIRLKYNKWFLPAISAVISLICAAVILANPFTTTLALWMFTGISLILEAIFDVIALFFNKNNGKSETI